MVALDIIEDLPLKRGLRVTFSEIERSFDSKINSLRTNINKIRKLKIQEDQITEMIKKTKEQE